MLAGSGLKLQSFLAPGGGGGNQPVLDVALKNFSYLSLSQNNYDIYSQNCNCSVHLFCSFQFQKGLVCCSYQWEVFHYVNTSKEYQQGYNKCTNS